MACLGARMTTRLVAAPAGLGADTMVGFLDLAVGSFLALVAEATTSMTTELWCAADSSAFVGIYVYPDMTRY